MGDLTGLLDRSIGEFQGGPKRRPLLLVGPAPLPVHDDLSVLEHITHGLPDACPAPLLVEGHQKSSGGKAPPFPIGHENGRKNDGVRVLVGFPRPVFAVVHLNGERPPRNVLGAIPLVLASGTHAGRLHPENFLHGSHHLSVIDLRIHPAVLDRVADLDRRRNDEFREPPGHGASHRQQLGAIPVEPQHEVPNQVDGHHTGNCLFQLQARTQPEFQVREPDPDSRPCHQVTLQVTGKAARLMQGL